MQTRPEWSLMREIMLTSLAPWLGELSMDQRVFIGLRLSFRLTRRCKTDDDYRFVVLQRCLMTFDLFMSFFQVDRTRDSSCFFKLPVGGL